MGRTRHVGLLWQRIGPRLSRNTEVQPFLDRTNGTGLTCLQDCTYARPCHLNRSIESVLGIGRSALERSPVRKPTPTTMQRICNMVRMRKTQFRAFKPIKIFSFLLGKVCRYAGRLNAAIGSACAFVSLARPRSALARGRHDH